MLILSITICIPILLDTKYIYIHIKFTVGVSSRFPSYSTCINTQYLNSSYPISLS